MKTCTFMKNEAFNILNKVFNSINIDILDHGHFFGDEDWKFYNVTSPFNRLYFIIDGGGYLENGSKKVLLEPGMMYLVPSHSTNTYICDSFIEKFYIHFRTELFFGKDIFETLDSCLSTPYDTARFGNILTKLKTEELEGIFLLKALLYETLGSFLPLISGNQESQLEMLYKYRNVYKLIKERRSWKLTPGEISEQTCIPLITLLKDFKKDTGCSLKNCINNMTLQWAKEKILLTDMSFKEIAFNLNFTDEFYFSRFFKKHTGLSPKEYRIKNNIRIYS